jgi:hypothetical protein
MDHQSNVWNVQAQSQSFGGCDDGELSRDELGQGLLSVLRMGMICWTIQLVSQLFHHMNSPGIDNGLAGLLLLLPLLLLLLLMLLLHPCGQIIQIIQIIQIQDLIAQIGPGGGHAEFMHLGLRQIQQPPELCCSRRRQGGGQEDQSSFQESQLPQLGDGRSVGGAAIQEDMTFIQHNSIQLTAGPQAIEEGPKSGGDKALRGDQDNLGPQRGMIRVPSSTRDAMGATAPVRVLSEGQQRHNDDGGATVLPGGRQHEQQALATTSPHDSQDRAVTLSDGSQDRSLEASKLTIREESLEMAVQVNLSKLMPSSPGSLLTVSLKGQWSFVAAR